MRIANLAEFQRSTSSMMSVQTRLHGANADIASGKRVHRYVDLGEHASVLVRTEAQLVDTRSFVAQNEQLGNRLNLMDSALSEIKDMAAQLQQLVLARRNDATGAGLPLDVEIDGIAERAAAKLNLRVEGRYAFGGSKTDVPPVDANAVLTDPQNATYYDGDQVTLRARIDVNLEASYGVRADEQPFRDFFNALRLAKEGHLTDDDAMLTAAANEARGAVESIINRVSELNAAMARVEGIKESQSGTILYLQDRVSSLTDTDVPATMAQIAQDQMTLEASYSITARLSQLSLADYLR